MPSRGCCSPARAGRDRRAPPALRREPVEEGGARRSRPARAANNNLGWATHALGDLARARDYYRRGLEAATEIGLVDVQLWSLFCIAALEAEAGDPRAAARLFGRMKELESRLGAATDDMDDVLERQTLARLEAALGPERLASELAAGAALSLEDAIDLALGRSDSATPG